jgi:hypothetical protein
MKNTIKAYKLRRVITKKIDRLMKDEQFSDAIPLIDRYQKVNGIFWLAMFRWSLVLLGVMGIIRMFIVLS